MSKSMSLIVVALALAATAAALDASQFSTAYRNWTYYTGGDHGFVVPPTAGDFPGQTLTDTAIVYEKTPDDLLPGRFRMTYLFFNGTQGNEGYEVALATSDDLLNWNFNRGGDNGLVFPRSADPEAYDYGGVTLGGMHFDNASMMAPRRLKKHTTGFYHALYGCYPSRSGYEAGNGGQGMARSVDGVVWSRVAPTVPVIPGASDSSPAWMNLVVYEPFLLEHNGTMFNFFNAKGKNEYGAAAEESGFATLPASSFPGVDEQKNRSQWVVNPLSPVIPSGGPHTMDSAMASDPKVFFDDDQGVWVMFYFGLGDASQGHADIMFAVSDDLVHWHKDPEPLYKAGGHPLGIDADHAHKVSVIYDQGVGYLYYTAVGPKGRGIALLTSKPVSG